MNITRSAFLGIAYSISLDKGPNLLNIYAIHDLTELVVKGLICREGMTGKGTIYRLVER